MPMLVTPHQPLLSLKRPRPSSSGGCPKRVCKPAVSMLDMSAREFWITHGMLVNRVRIMARVAAIKRPCYTFIDECRKKVMEMSCPLKDAADAWRMANVLCSLLNCGTQSGRCRFHVVWACDVSHRAFKCRVSEERHTNRVVCSVFSGACQFPSFHACYNSQDNALLVSGSTTNIPTTHSASCFYIVDVCEISGMSMARRSLIESVCPAAIASTTIPHPASPVPYHWTYCMASNSSYCANMIRMASAFCGMAVDAHAVEAAIETVLLEQGSVPDPYHNKADVFAAMINLWGQCTESSFDTGVLERAITGRIVERLYVTNECDNGRAHLYLRDGIKTDEWFHMREREGSDRISTVELIRQLRTMKLPVFVHDGGVTFFLCKVMQRACDQLKYAHRGAVLRNLFMATQHLLFGTQDPSARATLLQRNHQIGHASRFIFSLVMGALRMFGVEKELSTEEERDFSQVLMKQLFGEAEDPPVAPPHKQADTQQSSLLMSCC